MDKKQLRADIENKLTVALADFGKDVSDKKFKKHIKKAAKLLGDGLKPAAKKAVAAKKETTPVAGEAAPTKAANVKPAPKKPKAVPKKAAPKTPKAKAPKAAPATI